MLHPAAQGLAERLPLEALGVAERPRKPPPDGIDDGHRRDLASCQHERAQADRVAGQVLVDALVEPLVSTAQQDQLLELTEFPRDGVRELTAPRGQDDHVAVFPTASAGSP